MAVPAVAAGSPMRTPIRLKSRGRTGRSRRLSASSQSRLASDPVASSTGFHVDADEDRPELWGLVLSGIKDFGGRGCCWRQHHGQ